MRTKRYVFYVRDDAGAPIVVTPVWSTYRRITSGAPITAGPTISAVAGETGAYTFTQNLESGEYVIGILDLGASAYPETIEFAAAYEDYVDQTLGATLYDVKAKTDLIPASPATEATAEAARVAAVLARKLLGNKVVWDADTAVLSVYDDDGTTVIHQLVFKDAAGAPTTTSPLERSVV